MSKDKLVLLEREDIDDKLWNGCVHFAINALPFGYTWYLDNVAEHWKGLVWGDYQAVMPLVYKKKLGSWTIYQPELTRQLGLFSMNPPAPALMKKFVAAIPDEVKAVTMNLNALNSIDLEGYTTTEKSYYVIDMEPLHDDQVEKYSPELTEKLKVAYNAGLNIQTSLKPEPVVKLFEEQQKRHGAIVPEANRHALHRLIYKAEHYNVGGSVGVYKDEELVAAAAFIYGQRITLLIVAGATKNGEELNALELLVDHVVRTSAGAKRVLDLGAYSPGLDMNSFAEQYNAHAVPYWQMTRKNIPWYLKITQ